MMTSTYNLVQRSNSCYFCASFA